MLCGFFPVFSKELAPWNGAAVLSTQFSKSAIVAPFTGDKWPRLLNNTVPNFKKKGGGGHFGHGIFVIGRLGNWRSTCCLDSSTAVWLVMIWLTLWLTTKNPSSNASISGAGHTWYRCEQSSGHFLRERARARVCVCVCVCVYQDLVQYSYIFGMLQCSYNIRLGKIKKKKKNIVFLWFKIIVQHVATLYTIRFLPPNCVE